MADFSEYTGPSEEWLALEPNLPSLPKGQSIVELKELLNKGREDAAAKEMIDQGLQPKVTIRNHSIPARDGSFIEGRSYRPSSMPASQPLPIYVHLHGGGFLLGTLSSEDANCSRVVVALESMNSPVVVINVNYRHAPEHKYPVAWNDAEDAFHWIHDHLGEFAGDGERVILGGISAGSKLTASLILAQNSGKNGALSRRPRIKGQVLMIPALVHSDFYEHQVKQLRNPEVSSYVDNKDAPILPVSRIKLFMELLHEQGCEVNGSDRRLNPGNATVEEVTGLPPTTFGIAGRDPLRDEGLLYAKLLSENGVPTNVHVFKGVPHGFRRFADKLSVCKNWDDVIFTGIKWALSEPQATGCFEINAH